MIKAADMQVQAVEKDFAVIPFYVAQVYTAFDLYVTQ